MTNSSLPIPNTKEWLEWRNNKIGASDAPVIMEKSPWTTPYQLWQRKLGLVPELPDAPHKKKGRDLEVLAREELEKLTGLLFLPQCAQHPQISWLMASFDAIDPEQKHIREIKCPGKEDHAIAQSGHVPEKYYPQVQQQLEVAQLEMLVYDSCYPSWNPDLCKWEFSKDSIVHVTVYRDEKYIKKLLEKEQAFWECLQTWVAPKLTDKDFECITDPYWISLAEELADIESKISPYLNRKEILREQLKAITKRNSIGGGIKISRYPSKGDIDYKKIPELQNVNLELYRKQPSDCCRITIL